MAQADPRPTTFYHGTSVAAALSIQEHGFDPDRYGRNGRLGKGVYCTTTLEKAMGYARTRPAKGIIFELRVDLGKCKRLDPDDSMMTTWQQHGFDSAWAPAGAKAGGLEENCVKDPSRIKIVRAIAGHTGELLKMEMEIRPDGKLVKMPEIVAAAPNLRTYIIKVCIWFRQCLRSRPRLIGTSSSDLAVIQTSCHCPVHDHYWCKRSNDHRVRFVGSETMRGEWGLKCVVQAVVCHTPYGHWTRAAPPWQAVFELATN